MEEKLISEKKVEKILFTQKMHKYGSAYQTWYFPLKRLSNQIIFFDVHWNKILHGKKEMNKKFLEFVKKEKPDYIHMCFGPEDFEIDTFLKIRRISPNTKTLIALGDDDLEFEKFSRYIMLFVDYGLVHQIRYLKKYNKDGLDNVFGMVGLDTKFFKPINIEKKYDVTFVGLPLSKKSGRYVLLKFLMDKKINLRLFGFGWEKYPEFREIYGGPLPSEDLVRVLNESKINLCLSKNIEGKTHLKAKFLEGSGCKTFVLTEHCEEYLDLFKEGKEIIMFKNKEEMVKKINCYLKNEKEREKIAGLAYKRIIQEYGVDAQFKNIFEKISKRKKIRNELPKLNKKVFQFLKKDFNRNKFEIKKELEGYDYVSFIGENSENLNYKEFLQTYSLIKTKKPISCCDYYVSSKNLGDYLSFQSEIAFRNLNKEDFSYFLNLSQLLVTSEFFLNNLEKFKKSSEKGIDFLTNENTAFVGFPLLKVNNIPKRNYSVMKKAFTFKFLHDLYSLYYTKKLFYSLYLPSLILKILSGEFFLLKYLLEALKDKSRRMKLKEYEKTFKN